MRDWLSHRVVSSPDDTALIRAEDGEAWSYTDLDRLVSETAGRLVAHGLGEGDRIGVLTPPYVGTVGLVHATMRIGATFVPLGQELTVREIAARIERTDLDAVVCAEPTEPTATDAADRIEGVPVYSVDDPASAGVTGIHDVDPAALDPPTWSFPDPLCLLFTSGTTGEPKPVPLTAGNVYSSAIASAFRLGVEPDDRWLVSLSLHHMGGLAPVYRAVLYGTTLVLREGFDAGGTADDIDAYDVTGVSLVPTMLRRMLDRRGTLSDSLRAVLLGGAPAPAELLERCRDYSIPVYPTYGMTETASQITTATPRQTRDRIGTVGRPLFGTDVTVVGDDGDPVGAGEAGEIVVSGPTVTPGYLAGDDGAGADPDAVEVTGIDPGDLDRSDFGPHGLHTGDVGRFDEGGYLHVLNRVDDRIISGGENVEPGEVADVLRGFDEVEDVAVVGLDDEVWGERVAALVAVGEGGSSPENGETAKPGSAEPLDGDATDSDGVGSDDGATTSAAGEASADAVPEARPPGGAPIDEAAFLEYARERLAGFKIPKTVAYVEELPRTVSGTVDREATRATLRETGADPRGDDADLETAGFQPADPAAAETAGAENGDAVGPDDAAVVAESDGVAIADAESVAAGGGEPPEGAEATSVDDPGGTAESAGDERGGGSEAVDDAAAGSGDGAGDDSGDGTDDGGGADAEDGAGGDPRTETGPAEAGSASAEAAGAADAEPAAGEASTAGGAGDAAGGVEIRDAESVAERDPPASDGEAAEQTAAEDAPGGEAAADEAAEGGPADSEASGREQTVDDESDEGEPDECEPDEGEPDEGEPAADESDDDE